MARHAVIMTFPASKFDEYGFCIKGFRKYWSKDIQGFVIAEDAHRLKGYQAENLQIFDFDQILSKKINDFKYRNREKNISDLSNRSDITRQAEKFARKAYAQMYVLQNCDADYLHYIDADLMTLKPITSSFLDQLVSTNAFTVACTPRWWMRGGEPTKALMENNLHSGYTETGYMIWNKRSPHLQKWIDYYSECYDDDKIFEFVEWHDCIAFDYATLSIIKKFDAKILDLSFGCRSHHPLVVGPLGAYFDHMKGDRKLIGKSYERLISHGTLVQKLLFKSIKNFKYILRKLKT